MKLETTLMDVVVGVILTVGMIGGLLWIAGTYASIIIGK